VRIIPQTCPAAGIGVHRWLLSAANSCRLRGLAPADADAVLRDGAANCGRRIRRGEIEDAVAKGYSSAWTHRPARRLLPRLPKPTWPERDATRVAAVLADGGGLADLWEASPVRIEDNEPRTETIIDRLFPGNPLLCCGLTQSKFATQPRDAWRGELAELQFVVPSPMSAATGLTKDGRVSAHTLANTGPRRFLVVEFDIGTTDEHAIILLHLARYAPLVCALHSGGRSMHAWFLVAGQPADKVERFFRYAVMLGADRALWCRSQLCRMPDGKRDNGRRQTVYFLNFRPLEVMR